MQQTLLLAHIFFFELSAVLDVRHCPNLQSRAMLKKTNDVGFTSTRC